MLLAAKSVAYPDGARGAAAGASFDQTLKTLGIADEMQAKITRAQGGLQLEAKGVGLNPFGCDKALLAVGETGDDRAGAPLGSRRIHRIENVKMHQASFST